MPVKKPVLPAKKFSFDREDFWIEAYGPGIAGVSAREPVSFHISAISEIGGFGEKNSYIRLNSGREYLFDLPYAKLRMRLADVEEDVLDLKTASRPYTREMLEAVLREELNARFTEVARPIKKAGGKDITNEDIVEELTFKLWAHAPGQTNMKPITFSGTDIYSAKIEEQESDTGGRSLLFTLRNPSSTPFPGGKFVVEMSLRDFRNACDEAYMSLEDVVELPDTRLKRGFNLPPAPSIM